MDDYLKAAKGQIFKSRARYILITWFWKQISASAGFAADPLTRSFAGGIAPRSHYRLALPFLPWLGDIAPKQYILASPLHSVDPPLYSKSVYTVVKPVVKPVWQPVGCLFTRCSRLSNRLYNRTAACQTGLITGFTTGCIVYTNIQPVVKPDWQQVWQRVVSCKRGLREQPAVITLLLLLFWVMSQSISNEPHPSS